MTYMALTGNHHFPSALRQSFPGGSRCVEHCLFGSVRFLGHGLDVFQRPTFQQKLLEASWGTVAPGPRALTGPHLTPGLRYLTSPFGGFSK